MDWAKTHYGHPNIEFMYADYRDVEGKFDRVYSVGMFEHVGRASFATYFDKVYDVLVDDGIFLLHTLGWAKRGEWNHNGFDAWTCMFSYPSLLGCRRVYSKSMGVRPTHTSRQNQLYFVPCSLAS